MPQQELPLAAYKYTLASTPEGGFEQAIRVLVHDQKFVSLTERRKKLIESASRANPNSSQGKAILKGVQDTDRKMADMILHDLAFYQMRHDAAANRSLLTVEEFKKKYLTSDEATENYNNYLRSIDLAAFCMDIADGYMTDALDFIHRIDKGANFLDYDGVRTAMKALQSLTIVESKNVHPAINDIFVEYSDSINAYLSKRFATFNRKVKTLQEELIAKGELNPITKERTQKSY